MAERRKAQVAEQGRSDLVGMDIAAEVAIPPLVVVERRRTGSGVVVGGVDWWWAAEITQAPQWSEPWTHASRGTSGGGPHGRSRRTDRTVGRIILPNTVRGARRMKKAFNGHGDRARIRTPLFHDDRRMDQPGSCMPHLGQECTDRGIVLGGFPPACENGNRRHSR